MKKLISVVILLLTINIIFSQACISLQSWSESSNNGDGTCTYDVTVVVDSGNGASGTATFSIDGTNVFVQPGCVCNPSIITFPITVACNSTIQIQVFYDAPGNGNDCTGNTGDIVLPVVWIDFSGVNDGEVNIINWSVVENNNNYGYIVERSVNGINFEKIGELKREREEGSLVSYKFEDSFPLAGQNYYRIKQEDYDNSFTYSNLISINVEILDQIFVFPNPFSNTININNSSFLSWKIYDSYGKLLKMGSENIINTSLLPPGIYYIRILNEAIEHNQILVKS